VKKLIDDKAKGQKRQAPPPKPARSNVIDLVAALQESLVLFDKEVFVVIAHNMVLVCNYFAVGGACGRFKRMLKQQRPHGLRAGPG
jgi:hypothetical protein